MKDLVTVRSATLLVAGLAFNVGCGTGGSGGANGGASTAGSSASNGGGSTGGKASSAGQSGGKAGSNSTSGAGGTGGIDTEPPLSGGGESPVACDEPTPGPIGGSKQPPALPVGKWTNLTPKDLNLGDFGIIEAALDPSNPYTIYLAGGDDGGIYKTEDGGSTWKLLGTPGDEVNDRATTYLYNVYHIAVNPCDSQNLYATAGVRGDTLGFWVSKNGGASWTMPAGFERIATSTATLDVTSMAVDPTNFGHILVGSHSPWQDIDNAGILESTNGGETWTAHPPQASWGVGTGGLTFLFDPARGIGDKNTWLFATEGAGFWRTTNGGAAWTKVSDNEGVHGGVNFYRSKTGDLYSGGFGAPQRSSDNGATWADVSDDLQYGYYQTVHGDGNLLYTMPACACESGLEGDGFYFTSREDDGKSWSEFRGGVNGFGNGPFTLVYEKNTNVMYSVQWGAGFWALKVK